eukprot:1195510-Prorocentrum_minimum.AAC.7
MPIAFGLRVHRSTSCISVRGRFTAAQVYIKMHALASTDEKRECVHAIGVRCHLDLQSTHQALAQLDPGTFRIRPPLAVGVDET